MDGWQRDWGGLMARKRALMRAAELVLLTRVIAIGTAAVATNPSDRQTPGLQSDGSYLVTTNQSLTPIGEVQKIQGGRPKDLAVSPDGQLVAVLCTSLIALYQADGKPVW